MYKKYLLTFSLDLIAIGRRIRRPRQHGPRHGQEPSRKGKLRRCLRHQRRNSGWSRQDRSRCRERTKRSNYALLRCELLVVGILNELDDVKEEWLGLIPCDASEHAWLINRYCLCLIASFIAIRKWWTLILLHGAQNKLGKVSNQKDRLARS